MRFLPLTAFICVIGLVQSFPVQLPHYSLTNVPSNRSYIDEDTLSYYDRDSGILGTDKYQQYNTYHYQPYVANGFIGSRIPNLGFGFTYDQNANLTSDDLLNGWPIFDERFSGAFIGGFFDLENKKFPSTNFPELYKNGYESVISVVPQWTEFNFKAMVNGTEYVLNPRNTNDTGVIGTISDYNQELSIHDGIVTTSYKWLGLIEFKFQVLAHRSIESLGIINVELKSDQDVDITVESFIDFSSSVRCQFVESGIIDDDIYMVFKPHLVDSVNGTIYSVLRTGSEVETGTSGDDGYIVTQSSRLQLASSQIYNITKHVGISSTDHSNGSYFDVAKSAAQTQLSSDELLIIHQQSWYDLIGRTKISVPASEMITLASEASLYHLLANQRSSSTGVDSALSVGGLSSDSYGGMQFWDTDLWMLPSMIPFAPEVASAVSKYRIYTHEQAKINAELNDKKGAVYPWTSARYGNCTSTGPCLDYEYHINVAVAFSVWKLYLSGAVDDAYMTETAFPIFQDAAEFFTQYVQYNDTLQKYTTKNLTDPDEYANQVDNGAYTNVGISQLLKWATVLGNHLGLHVDDRWMEVARDMYLPESQYNVTLEYDTMNSSIEVKQADVILITYPLDDEDGALEQNFGYDRAKALDDLFYYSEHQSAQGPAMTFPVFSIVSGKLSDKGCSSTSYLKKSIDPFLRFPFAQMSEQNYDDYDGNGGTHPAFPFLTGHGGVLQNVIYGLTGLKFGYDIGHDSKINRKLLFDPVKLPCLPGGVQVENFQYQGVQFYVEINDVEAIISHLGNLNTSITVEVNDRNPQAGNYTLTPYASLHVALYETEQNVLGSVTECSATVIDSSESIHGDVVDTVNDGDNSTTWQSTQESAYLLFDLGEAMAVNEGLIIWGDNPAKYINLYGSADEVSVSEIKKGQKLLSNHSVEISNAFNAAEFAKIQAVSDRNFTSFTFDANVTTGLRYVLLELEDSYEGDGAIIAEFNLMT